MKLETAISAMSAPKNFEMIMTAALTNDTSIFNTPDALTASMQFIDEQIATHQKKLDNCQSDLAYWSILGDLAYWRAAKNIHLAAEITGADRLPDIPVPNMKNGILMDIIGKVEQFGKDLLNEAKKINPLPLNN